MFVLDGHLHFEFAAILVLQHFSEKLAKDTDIDLMVQNDVDDPNFRSALECELKMLLPCVMMIHMSIGYKRCR